MQELVDLQLTDLSTGGTIGASFCQDAQVPLPGEWCMASISIELNQGIRPIGSTRGQGSQLPDCFLHSGNPGLIWVYPHCGEAIHSIRHCPVFSGNK